MTKNYKGFTLIEMLVVVLIIGILAAIALPQYQLSRDKAEFAKFQSIGKSLADAYSRYYLITNDYPDDIEKLDVDLPIGYEKTGFKHSNRYPISCAVYDNFYCCIAQRKPQLSYYPDLVVCSRKDYAFQYKTSYMVNENPMAMYCLSPGNTARGKRLCENVSSNNFLNEDINFITPTGFQYKPTNAYKL